MKINSKKDILHHIFPYWIENVRH